MKLSELLSGARTSAIHGDDSIDVAAISSDSRRVAKGGLFIAVPGFLVDGAKFVDAAIAKGAAAIITEQPLERPGVTLVVTPDARETLAVVAANFYGRPAAKLQLIGVTGTSGKTTTTKMVESIIDATGEPAGLIGTIEYRAGDTKEIADRTTPDAVSLQEWFAKMVTAGVRLGVMEVSSHALALKRTFGVPFAAAVFTNLSRDHFDFHKDFEDYFAAKRILFDQIDRTKRTAVVNVDDEYGRRLAKELGDAVISFGRDESADIHPRRGFEVSVNGLHGILETPAGPVKVDSELIGYPNLYNWMAAVGAALVTGIGNVAIERGITMLRAVRGRFERVPVPNGPTVLVDYAHKPDALEKLLNAARELAPGHRIVVVFGCGGDRDKGKRPEMGEIAGRLADYTVLTSDNPRSEKPDAIIDEIEAGIRRAAGASYERITDRREAIRRTLESADAGTLVIVAGKGHENYQVIGDEIVHFDDREEVELAAAKRAQK